MIQIGDEFQAVKDRTGRKARFRVERISEQGSLIVIDVDVLNRINSRMTRGLSPEMINAMEFRKELTWLIKGGEEIKGQVNAADSDGSVEDKRGTVGSNPTCSTISTDEEPFTPEEEAEMRGFISKIDAALEFIPEGEVIPYDIGTKGIVIE